MPVNRKYIISPDFLACQGKAVFTKHLDQYLINILIKFFSNPN